VKVALDTNVLAYAEGTNGADMKDAALRLIHALPAASVALPVQALGKLFNVLVLKAKRPASTARAAILSWRDAYAVVDTSPVVMLNAADLSTDHHLRIWDAVILSASAEAGCRLLLSEDLQEGFTWRGVTVTNPFGATPHPLLTTLIGESAGSE
jgi:predicted nucleic acid-binding protein